MTIRGQDFRCTNCNISFSWTPVWVKDQPYCCTGCAMGGPCTCTYDSLPEGEKTDMKMILAIVQDEDAGRLLQAISQHGWRATKVSTTGGFLRSGNTTVLIGVEDEQVDAVLDTIRSTCRTRRQPAIPLSGLQESMGPAWAAPAVEVEVGGANIFVWNVERYIRV